MVVEEEEVRGLEVRARPRAKARHSELREQVSRSRRRVSVVAADLIRGETLEAVEVEEGVDDDNGVRPNGNCIRLRSLRAKNRRLSCEFDSTTYEIVVRDQHHEITTSSRVLHFNTSDDLAV